MNPSFMIYIATSSVFPIAMLVGYLDIPKQLSRMMKRLRKAFRAKKYTNLLPEGAGKLIDALFCPLTNELMREPMLTPQGYCFELKAIKKYIKNHGKCPLTSEVLDVKDLRLCYTLMKAIEEYKRAELSVCKDHE